MNENPASAGPAERGSYVAGRRVKLPDGAEPPYAVFINGVSQAEGTDYEIGDGEIVFNRPLVKEKVSGFRWLIMFLSVAGSYRKHETVDIGFRRNGRIELAGDVPVLE